MLSWQKWGGPVKIMVWKAGGEDGGWGLGREKDAVITGILEQLFSEFPSLIRATVADVKLKT